MIVLKALVFLLVESIVNQNEHLRPPWLALAQCVAVHECAVHAGQAGVGIGADIMPIHS